MARQITRMEQNQFGDMVIRDGGKYVLWKDVAPYIKEVENTTPNTQSTPCLECGMPMSLECFTVGCDNSRL